MQKKIFLHSHIEPTIYGANIMVGKKTVPEPNSNQLGAMQLHEVGLSLREVI